MDVFGFRKSVIPKQIAARKNDLAGDKNARKVRGLRPSRVLLRDSAFVGWGGATMITLAKPAAIALENILVVTDLSPVSRSALEYARPIAQQFHSVVHILHVVRRGKMDLLPPPVDADDKDVIHAKEQLHELETRLGAVPHRIWLREGQISSAVRELVRTEHMDLLIAGASGKSNLEKFLVGSVAEELLRSAPCPVLTFGPHASGKALDGSAQVLYVTGLWEESHHGLRYAIRLAAQYNCQLLLLHVIEQDEPRQTDREWLKDYRRLLQRLLPETSVAALPLEPVLRLEVARDSAMRILQVADEIAANLIVMDVRPEEDWTTHLQDKVYKIISRASCPVLTLQTQEEYATSVEETAVTSKTA
jgi:nucleotide-binding universal stress UspA family protein